MLTSSSVACTDPYTHNEIRLPTQIPPGSRKRHFRLTESSFITLHRVLCSRLLGICLLLRSSRVTIGTGDAYRTKIGGLELTSVGPVLSGLEKHRHSVARDVNTQTR
jgi:hypothetical protein